MEIIEAIVCILYQRPNSTLETISTPVAHLLTKEIHFNYLTLCTDISLPEVKLLEVLGMHSRTFWQSSSYPVL